VSGRTLPPMRATIELPADLFARRPKVGAKLPIALGAATDFGTVVSVRRRRPWDRRRLVITLELPLLRHGWGSGRSPETENLTDSGRQERVGILRRHRVLRHGGIDAGATDFQPTRETFAHFQGR